MDRNSKHFPTLLVIFILTSIIIYIISNVVYYFRQRKNSSNRRTVVEFDEGLPESINEEEQDMVNYLKSQEDN